MMGEPGINSDKTQKRLVKLLITIVCKINSSELKSLINHLKEKL